VAEYVTGAPPGPLFTVIELPGLSSVNPVLIVKFRIAVDPLSETVTALPLVPARTFEPIIATHADIAAIARTCLVFP